ncbi:MAG: hypothetical protein HQL22_10550 [Candidatus Omnitrophica bacterium]|nr:hypothetical protein [Candidatus Omnitrophota bacterium]
MKTQKTCDPSAMTPLEVENIGYPTAIKGLKDIQLQYNKLRGLVTATEAQEFWLHGLLRRIGTLKANLNRVLAISPPTRSKKLNEIEFADLTAHLQCFYINHFGVYNNLALIWTFERLSIQDRKQFIKPKYTPNIFNKDFKRLLPFEMRKQINQSSVWYKNLIDFRHPLAHAIPFYVVPYFLTADEARKDAILEERFLKAKSSIEMEIIMDIKDSLGKYYGGHITGSFNKNKLMPIHQIVADTNTLVEILKTFAKVFVQNKPVIGS